MTFKRTTPITALDLDSSDLPDASASSKGGVYQTVVHAKKHGVVGDGVADDTAALQAMLTAAAGRKAFVPKGTYLLTSALLISSYTTLEADPNAVFLRAASGLDNLLRNVSDGTTRRLRTGVGHHHHRRHLGR
jgi:polygalacturonase